MLLMASAEAWLIDRRAKVRRSALAEAKELKSELESNSGPGEVTMEAP